MPKTIPDNVYYIHTTHTIIDYINIVSARYIAGIQTVHLLDESMLGDIKKGDVSSAQSKLQHLVQGALHSGAQQIMVTCTSTGRLVDSLPPEYVPYMRRIELPAVAALEAARKRTNIVYTNPTVWPEMQQILQERGVDESLYVPLFVAGAFEKILAGDKAGHDLLIQEHLERNSTHADAHLLAQVSICSALERLGELNLDAKVISLAELGIMSLTGE